MNLSDKTSSFGLVRTNPKLSGNIKLTVDSKGDIWLNSIDANKVLSGSEFKKFRLAPTSSFDVDVRDFIGSVPPEVLFEVRQDSNPESTGIKFTSQLELFYSMGAEPLISKLYDEAYSYLAPLWLREDIPNYFVILRVDEPTDFAYNEDVPSGSIVVDTPTEYKVVGDGYEVVYESNLYVNGDTFTSNISTVYTVFQGSGKVISLNENKDLPINNVEQFNSILKRAQIIKTFDLTSGSKIGQYIRNFRNNPRFPAAPITTKFEDGLMTTWNGIAYQDGILSSKGEFMRKYWQSAQTQMEFEEYVTNGFQRHGIICPHLLNMEFLFNDETASLYSIPRYFGFYVNEIPTGSFELDGDKLFAYKTTSGNTPTPKRSNRGYRDQGEAFYQNNPDGVRLFYMNPEGFIPSSTDFYGPNFEPRLYWVQDKKGLFYSLNQNPEVIGDYNTTITDIQVRNKAVNLGDFAGEGRRLVEGFGSLLTDKGRSYMVLKIKDQLYPNDKIKIHWNIGSQVDGDGPFDEITANDLRRVMTIPANGTLVSIYGNYVPYYNVGDEIEIQYGQNVRIKRTITSVAVFALGYTTFNINLPIDLTTTNGYVSIVEGWGPGQSLAANNYNPIYFHPYGTTNEVTRSIASALNRIEQRTWDAIAIDNEVVIRMRAGASAPNAFFCNVDMTDYTRIELQRQLVTNNTTKVYFEGGTDNNHIRFRYDLANFERLTNNGEVFVKSKLGLAKIVHVGRYVDDPILETGGSDIGNLDGWNDFGVAYIDDLLDEPLVGITTKTFTAYNLFRPKVGLFSFFNLKDIDGDFFSSTYSRTPIREYHRYFDIPADTQDMIIEGRQYIVLGSDPTVDQIEYNAFVTPSGNTIIGLPGATSFTVVSGNPVVVPAIFYQRAVMPYETLIPGHTYLVVGDAFVDSITYPTFPPTKYGGFYFTAIPGAPTYSINTGTPVVVDITAPELDSDIKSFPGFFTFRDFLTVEEEAVDKNTLIFNQRDKFFFNTVPSEYDYLKENYLKEFAIRSRMMPSTSKWVYAGGTDVRDNGYRLNTHPIFGSFNFAPSFTQKTQNPEAFTHEWYYLEGQPHNYPAQFLNDNYYFFPEKLDIAQLKDTNPANQDYFLEYFTFQPSPNTPDQDRYTIFNFNPETGVCETFFRGVKVQIKEVIRDTAAVQLRAIKPPFKQGSTKFDGYKYSTILRVHKETPNVVESPVLINVYENSEHKTITMVIDLILEDYRTLELINPYNLGSIYSPEVRYQDLVDISTDYVTLYSMKSKKVEHIYNNTGSLLLTGTDVHQIGDIKLSVSLTMASPSGAIGPFTYGYAYDNPDYDWDMRDEIQNFRKENYFTGQFVFGDTWFPYPLSSNQQQILFGIPGTLGYAQDPLNEYGKIPALPTGPFGFFAPYSVDQFNLPIAPNNISVPFGSSFEWQGFATYQKEGGLNFYNPIMQRIAFATLAQKINEYSQYVKYKTYKWNGFSNVETTDEFYLELVEPTTITKIESLIPIIDEDKPEEFNNVPIIGVELTKVNSASVQYRYNGPYEPKFKNVLFFRGQKQDEIAGPGFDLSFKQATFNPNVNDFGLIKNMNYLKVSNSTVLDLANNNKYKSLYPLVGEIAIDQKDHFVFRSSWDPGFWRMFSSKTNFVNQAGTREMKEVKNFMGTKIMKTQDSIRLQDFTVEEVATLALINMDNVDAEIAWTQNATTVSGLVNIKKRLLRFFVETGANAEFVKLLMPEFGVGDPDSLDDDVIEYLTLNVLPVYEVKQADPYTKKYKDNTLSLPIVRGDLSDANKLISGYIHDKNFTVTRVSDFLYSFEYKIDPSTEVSMAISFDIGRI